MSIFVFHEGNRALDQINLYLTRAGRATSRFWRYELSYERDSRPTTLNSHFNHLGETVRPYACRD
jgi:hypothetical protein